MNTPSNNIPNVPENTIDPAAGLNEALNVIDILLQLRVESVLNGPPVTAVNGQRHIVGTAPSGPWASVPPGMIARYTFPGDYWNFYEARYALNAATGRFMVRPAGTWISFGGAADTGWTAGTGTASKGTFATGSATTADCAQRILALENACRAFGVIV